MFEEGNDLYSPVTVNADGSATVELDRAHPGFADPAYRERRGRIAALALAWREGEPMPEVAYTEQEQGVWRTVARELAAKHRRLACPEYLEGAAALALPADRVPQLAEVGERLLPLTGFRYHPAAGLVPLRQFYGSFARGVFHSTQYLRHHSVPLYTPEPDAIHEIVGHANQLAHPRFAALYRAVGEAVGRLEREEALELVSRAFWFTLEFGVVGPAGHPERTLAYGAGILSSYGEIDEFRACEQRPLDIPAAARQPYDITHYQPVLFRADSIAHLEDALGGFLAAVDDDAPARLGATAAA